MKNCTKSEQNHAKYPVVTQNFNPRYLLKKRKFNKTFFRILRWTRFLMIPRTFLYDEYIDRPKLSEQKKTQDLYVFYIRSLCKIYNSKCGL